MYIITKGAYYELEILGYVDTEEEAIKICQDNRVRFNNWCEYKKKENEISKSWPKYESSVVIPSRPRFPSGIRENSPEWHDMRAKKSEYERVYNEFYEKMQKERDTYYQILKDYIIKILGPEPPSGYEHMGYEQMNKYAITNF